MRLITGYVVFSRLSFVALTLLLVKGPDDLERVALFNGLTHIAAAVIALIFVSRSGYWPIWPGMRYTLQILRSSTGYFWSRLAVVSYGAGAILFLGTFSSASQVALYSVAEQFYRGALAVYSPVTQALYPHMARYRDVLLFKKLFKIVLALACFGIISGLALGKWLIALLFGADYEQSYTVFVVFMLALAVAIPSILLGYPFLGAMGNPSAANRSVLFAGFVQLITLGMLWIYGWTSALAVVVAVLIAEISALVWRVRYALPYFKITK